MKFWRKWFFLILLLACGFVYLSAADGWQVYAKSLGQFAAYCRELLQGLEEALPAPSGSEAREDLEGEGESGRPGSEQEGTTPSDGRPATPGGEETASGEGGTLPGGGEAASGEGGTLPGEGGAASGEGGTLPGEPTYLTVEDDYFADAVFIGDSRTVGMSEYGGLEETSTFYASSGLTIHKLFDAEIVKVPGQKKKMTVEEALREKTFAKIYLMLGINEMGTGTLESFTAKYAESLAHLQELQPDAVIYVQGIMKVTTERSSQGDYITNEGIEARNAELAKLADNEKVFYLDVNPMICDETGGLVASYTSDGVHLKAKYIQIWKDFLKTHAVAVE